MSGRRDAPPSSGVLGDLDDLRHRRAGPERTRRAWQLVGRAYGSADLPLVLDFALEHGLVTSCEDAWQEARRARPPRYLLWVNPADGSEMIWIPAGPFYVGPTKAKKPAESKGFSLARHPVTNGQFAKFLAETDYTPPAGHPDPETFLPHWSGGRFPNNLEHHPVVWVSYLDALAYCDWAGLTLPTEWLWEKAARGPDGASYPWGDQYPVQGWGKEEIRLANVRSPSTCPVGNFPRTRTAYGCEDMVGNVSEWCQMIEGDQYGHLPGARPTIQIPAGVSPVYAAVR